MPLSSKKGEKDPEALLRNLKAYNEDSLITDHEELFKNILQALAVLSNNQEFWQSLNIILQNLSSEHNQIENLVCYEDGSVAKLIYQALVTQSKREKPTNLSGILEALTTIADTNKGRERCSAYLEDIVGLFSNYKLDFAIRLELCKLINILLEQLPKSKICQLKENQHVRAFLAKSGDHLREAGDFDLQATILEALFRLLDTSEKEVFAKQWFQSEIVKGAFLTIRNEEFENGCRIFLNELNSHTEKRKVYSCACLAFYLGTYKLKVPGYHELKSFWVDFNIGSKSISAFVNDDADESTDSAWEIVVIKAEAVKDVRVHDNGTDLTVILKLSIPPCDLVPFCPNAQENYAKVVFPKDHIISKALSAVFVEVKYTEMPMSSPSISSTPTKASTVQNPFWIRSTFKESEAIIAAEETTFANDGCLQHQTSAELASQDSQVKGNITDEGIIPETQEDNDVACPKEVEFVVPQQLIIGQQITKELSNPGKKTTKTEKIAKKPRKLPERKTKSKSFSPFAFHETSIDEKVSCPQQQPNNPKQQPKDSKITKISSSEEGYRNKKLYGSAIKSSGEEFNPDLNSDQIHNSIWTSETQIGTDVTNLSFTDPRKVKKKKVLKTFEKKKQMKAKRGRPKKESVMKARTAKPRLDEMSSDSTDEITIKKEFQNSRGRMKNRPKYATRKAKEQQDSYLENDKIKVDKKSSKLYSKKVKDVIAKRRVAFLKSEQKKAKKKVIAEELLSPRIHNMHTTLECTPESITWKSWNNRRLKDQEDALANEMSSAHYESGSSPVKSDLERKAKVKKRLLNFVRESVDEKKMKYKDQSNEHAVQSFIIEESTLHDVFEPNAPDDEKGCYYNPVDSFARICENIVNLSRQVSNTPSRLKESPISLDPETPRSSKNSRSKNGNSKDLSTPNPISKISCDSGILSDISALGSKADATITSVEKISSFEGKGDEISCEDEAIEDAMQSSNEQDVQEDYKQGILPRWKTPEVVKNFRKNILQENKIQEGKQEKKLPTRKRTQKRRISVSDQEDEASSPFSVSSPAPVKRKTAPKFLPMRDDDSDEDLEKEESDLISFSSTNKRTNAGGTENDLQSLLMSFGDHMENSVKRKQQLVHKFTDSAAELLKKNLSSVWRNQRDERKAFFNGMKKNIQMEMEQLRKQMESNLESEENMLRVLIEHQKEKVESIAIQKQRVDNVQQMNSLMFSGLEKLEEKQSQEKSAVDAQLRKEMNKMQSTLLRESRKQEIHHVQRNLKGILSSL